MRPSGFDDNSWRETQKSENDSLHAMHRSYRMGRQSGSLSEERISMLTDHGFKFRDELLGDETVKTV